MYVIYIIYLFYLYSHRVYILYYLESPKTIDFSSFLAFGYDKKVVILIKNYALAMTKKGYGYDKKGVI